MSQKTRRSHFISAKLLRLVIAAFVFPIAKMQRWLSPEGRVLKASRLALTTLVLILALFFLGDLFRSAHTSAQAGRTFSLFALSDWFRPAQPLPQASSFTFSSPLELTGHPPSPVFFQADAEPEIKVDLFGNIYVTAI